MVTSVSPTPAPLGGSGGSGGTGSAATSKIFLFVAVLLGILATVLAFFFINTASVGNTGPSIRITVATHDLTPNTPLEPSRDLRTMDIPAKFSGLAQRCLNADALGAYRGARVNREIFADQPVLLADLVNSDFLVLEKPYVALTLSADTNMIIPGDFVKILVTKSNMVNAVATAPVDGVPAYDTTILGGDTGFKVLAVGTNLFKTRQQSLFVETGASNSNTKTVTLQVTEAQAKQIMGELGSASSSNKATLLLCPSEKTKAPEGGETEPAPAATRPATHP